MYKVVFVLIDDDYRGEHDIGPFDTVLDAKNWIEALEWDLSEDDAHCDLEDVNYYQEGLGFRIEEIATKLYDPTKWAADNPTWESAHDQTEEVE